MASHPRPACEQEYSTHVSLRSPTSGPDRKRRSHARERGYGGHIRDSAPFSPSPCQLWYHLLPPDLQAKQAQPEAKYFSKLNYFSKIFSTCKVPALSPGAMFLHMTMILSTSVRTCSAVNLLTGSVTSSLLIGGSLDNTDT